MTGLADPAPLPLCGTQPASSNYAPPSSMDDHGGGSRSHQKPRSRRCSGAKNAMVSVPVIDLNRLTRAGIGSLLPKSWFRVVAVGSRRPFRPDPTLAACRKTDCQEGERAPEADAIRLLSSREQPILRQLVCFKYASINQSNSPARVMGSDDRDERLVRRKVWRPSNRDK